jgi:hypothetical protein
MVIRRSFSLDKARDGDVVAWLDAQDNASEAIRAALRAHISRERLSLADVYQAVKALEAQVCSGQWVRPSAADVDEPVEDPALAAQLDQLGL